MKLKFKKQVYQTHAVEAVADCFVGQPANAGIKYRIDPGREAKPGVTLPLGYEEAGRLVRFYEDGIHGYTYLESVE